MTHRRKVLVAVQALALALFLGCDTSPVTQWVDTRASPDTLPHPQYEWTIQDFGLQGVLWDVCALSDTEAYAVGYVQTHDSLGNLKTYNAAHWDGRAWELTNILFNNSTSLDTTRPMRSQIFSITQDGNGGYLMCGSGSVLFHDGRSYVCDRSLLDFGLGVWYTSGPPGNRYFAGENGNVAYSKHHRLYHPEPSITDQDFTDIASSESEVFAVGNLGGSPKTACIMKRNGVWVNIDSLVRPWQPFTRTVWSDAKGLSGGGFVAFGGTGIVYYDTTWKTLPDSTVPFFRRIRGRARNDVWAVGDFGRVLHYNGSTWHWYRELWNYPNSRLLYGVTMTKNYLFFVGHAGRPAVIVTGRRVGTMK